MTVEPLLDAGPLLLPAALLPQLTLDTGPLDLQFIPSCSFVLQIY